MARETVWVITRHEPDNLYVEFLSITPGLRAVKIQVALEDNHDGTTAAHLAYIYTALSEQGNNFLTHVTEEHFRQAMNYYLETGTTLKAHAPH